MSKYYGKTEPMESFSTMNLLMPDEHVIWQGYPKKSAYVLNASLKMAPIALIWLAFDGFFIFQMLSSGTDMGGMGWFLVIFFAIHLFPVWMWLSSALTAGARWKNTEYVVTNKRIMIRNGLIGYEYNSLYYTDIANVSLSVGVIDRMCGVGDIHISMNRYTGGSSNGARAILDVPNPERVFGIVQKTVLDMQTDIHFPNAMRPDHNPGYQTQYRP